MRSKLIVAYVLVFVCLLSLVLSACQPEQAGVVSTAAPLSKPTESVSTVLPSPSEPPALSGMLEVVFVNDGNIQVWEEATQQTRTIVNTGDVFSVTMSDDGQMIAYTRGAWVGGLDGYEQFALWALNRADGNPRELISAQALRQQLYPSERESSNFFQLSWLPRSHQLIFSGTKYIAQGEGLSHALPLGAYLVDTDHGSVTVLADITENLHFLPAPDGKQIALMSPSEVGFINADGSNPRQEVLTYAEAGLGSPLFPMGAWTQDSSALVVTGSFQSDPDRNIEFTIWHVPADGSSLEPLANITESTPNSVTFSADGKLAAFLQTTDQQPAEIAGWFIKSLIPEAGPLALPYYGTKNFYANLHWSPAGEAFVIQDQALLQLCPDATQDSQVCGEPIHLDGGIITGLQWVDASRFLFESVEPNALSLGNVDGTITPIVTWKKAQRWTENEILSGWSFDVSP